MKIEAKHIVAVWLIVVLFLFGILVGEGKEQGEIKSSVTYIELECARSNTNDRLQCFYEGVLEILK